MKPKTVLIFLIVLFIVMGFIVWGYYAEGTTTASVQGVEYKGPTTTLAATSTLYDFGTISMKDGNVTKDFTFTNPTNKDILVPRVETSCMCTSALLVEPDGSTKGPFGMASMGANTRANDTIKPGETRTLRVIYNPNAHGPAGVGQIDRFILVTDSAGGTLRYEIKALVKP